MWLLCKQGDPQPGFSQLLFIQLFAQWCLPKSLLHHTSTLGVGSRGTQNEEKWLSLCTLVGNLRAKILEGLCQFFIWNSCSMLSPFWIEIFSKRFRIWGNQWLDEILPPFYSCVCWVFFNILEWIYAFWGTSVIFILGFTPERLTNWLKSIRRLSIKSWGQYCNLFKYMRTFCLITLPLVCNMSLWKGLTGIPTVVLTKSW